MRTASCQCGQLSVNCPDQYLIQTQCGCKDCQRRTGTPSAFQLHYKSSDVSISGSYKSYGRESASDGDRRVTSFFCPDCGGTVWLIASWSESVFGEAIYQVSLGCFDDLNVQKPDVSAWTGGLPDWMEPLSAREFQMEKQPVTIDDLITAIQPFVKF
jgi:hypothetical protein